MSKQLQIGNKIFDYPEAGDNPGWGEDTAAWAEAVTEALQSVQGPNDILTTSTALSNNVSTPTPVAGLSFDLSQVRRITAEYFIVRVFDAGATTVTESGTILGDYNGTELAISVEAVGDSGVRFDANNTGQILYTSDDKTDNVSITLTFEAKTIDNP